LEEENECQKAEENKALDDFCPPPPSTHKISPPKIPPTIPPQPNSTRFTYANKK